MAAATVWSAGLLGLSALMGYVGLVELPRIEQDIRSNVEEALRERGLTNLVAADVSGRTVRLDAKQASPEALVALTIAEVVVRQSMPPVIKMGQAGDWISGPLQVEVSAVELTPPAMSDIDMARGHVTGSDAGGDNAVSAE